MKFRLTFKYLFIEILFVCVLILVLYQIFSDSTNPLLLIVGIAFLSDWTWIKCFAWRSLSFTILSETQQPLFTTTLHSMMLPLPCLTAKMAFLEIKPIPFYFIHSTNHYGQTVQYCQKSFLQKDFMPIL